ncbi:ATP-binding protein [Streptomyces chrestomyceticus]|uniref:ATP-binding protein n=1 Tax=Streptomyces chrestomyceticus TaxID=68185 RepID=UPI0036C4570E
MTSVYRNQQPAARAISPPLEEAIDRGLGERASAEAVQEVSRVRRTVQERLSVWGLTDDFAYEVTLLVAEVLTNAVVHGRGQVVVQVDYCANALSISISDQSPQPPEPGRAGPEDQNGRGWDMAKALATGRGGYLRVVTHREGKEITALLPVPLPSLRASARCA